MHVSTCPYCFAERMQVASSMSAEEAKSLALDMMADEEVKE